LLDAPVYTRPQEFRGKKVPEVLLSGNHGEIEQWRKEKAVELTKKYRKDIMEN
ncbi:MAG: tRNA (guanosine(37)-N1)-methyltransferase TrmD, partial [candidate division WOR-3 bacterium]